MPLSVMGALAVEETGPELTLAGDAPSSGLAEPSRILAAGDWHTDRMWAVNMILDQVPRQLAAETRRIVLQLGDFGYWPDDIRGTHYLIALTQALETVGAELWFIDGNHEQHDYLSRHLTKWQQSGDPADLYVADRVRWLPRGLRWTWHDRTWVAVGGAASPNRSELTEGWDWFPQEELSDVQVKTIIDGGAADVLVSHDCPAGVVHTFPDPPERWLPADIGRCEDHARILQRIVDDLQPAHIMHGHLHTPYQRYCDFGYGQVAVTGLAENGAPYNWATLDVQTMTWASPGPEPLKRDR